MSDHTCPVIRVKLEKHHNADSLSIVKIGGYQCIVKTKEWEGVRLAIYIPPDSIVPDTEQFKFLDGKRKIKVKKIRGHYSQGLLIPCPDWAIEGQDCMEDLNITHYEPPVQISMNGNNVKAPDIYPHYDIENYRNPKFQNIFKKDETVVVTEKIHGSNARFVFKNDEMFAGSRKNWKEFNKNNLWWRAIKQNPWVETWCRENEGSVLYGEIFGPVQKLKYGAKNNDMFFRVFDIWQDHKWLSFDEIFDIEIYPCICECFNGSMSHIVQTSLKKYFELLKWVPVLDVCLFGDGDFIVNQASGKTKIAGADHIREGIVVKPIKERMHPKLERVQLKIVSDQYLLKNF